jgi:HEAT repeat protein
LDQLLNEPATSDGAAIALSFMNSNAVPVFTNALSNKDITVKNRAVKGLGMMGAKAETAVPILLNILKEDSSLQNLVMESLGNIGSMPDLVVPQLIQRLYRPGDPAGGKPLELNLYAVDALAGFGTNAIPAVPEILKALPLQNGFTRNEATNALRLINPALLQH